GYGALSIEHSSNVLVERNSFALNESYRIEPFRPAGVRIRQSTCLFTNNIVALNVNGWGIGVSGVSSLTLDCNDVWNNDLGSYSGVSPGASDFSANPEFCNVGLGDLSLSSSSPCLDVNNALCGQVGAVGLGCSVALGVGEETEGTVSVLSARPVSQGAVLFSLHAPAGDISSDLSVFDLRGRLVYRAEKAFSPESPDHVWTRNHGLSSGIYFARLGTDRTLARTKVLIVR
ncbi:MAG: T9SS type A sorting domain-containing protein, partial [Rhodothermales bacterium]|nr:T9SS type A sorting domain-containing protein [Rhodothermales bacterium]